MRKQIVEFHSSGESGNIFWILACVRKILQKQQRIIDYNNVWEQVQTCESYEKALAVIREYVDLVDLDGRY
ncbi:MAG: hypothetical protein RRZ69_05945 [Clostridia bacterium]